MNDRVRIQMEDDIARVRLVSADKHNATAFVRRR